MTLPGALHLKLYLNVSTGKVYAIITTGLTHMATRSSVVAVDVTDPRHPVQVASVRTACECTEGVIVIPNAATALIGSCVRIFPLYTY